jgi:cobalt-zinc-cadmium efflux system outer membrane protein
LAFGLFTSQEKEAAAPEVADRFQALREVLVQRDPAGITPLLETRMIEATELTLQRKASQASLETKAALLELNQLRGAEPQSRLAIARPELVFRPPEEVTALIVRARTNNFELRTRGVELTQQGLRLALARNERFPTISAGPMISEERAGERERIIGLAISLPIPVWNRNTGNIDAARARQAQAQVSLHLLERELERKVRTAAAVYQTKLEEMQKWRADAVQHFKAAAELSDRHYRLGAVPITTYIELQKNYLDAVDALLETKLEALEAAGQLEEATGLTTPLVRLGQPGAVQ